jgi:hypothetical protein
VTLSPKAYEKILAECGSDPKRLHEILSDVDRVRKELLLEKCREMMKKGGGK